MNRSSVISVLIPAAAIAAVAGIVVLLFGGVSLSGSSPTPAPTPTLYYPLGEPVIFNSITDPSGTMYLPGAAMPEEIYTVSNPVTVALAIGAGLRYQDASETPRQNYGHLHILIDDEVLPIPGDIVEPAENRISLSDGSHIVTLPDLEPGRHDISAVFTNSRRQVTLPYGVATIKLDVRD
jgi:hypothetical protein